MLWNVKPCDLSKLLYKLAGTYFLCLQGDREKTEDKNTMLWDWIRGARAVG